MQGAPGRCVDDPVALRERLLGVVEVVAKELVMLTAVQLGRMRTEEVHHAVDLAHVETDQDDVAPAELHSQVQSLEPAVSAVVDLAGLKTKCVTIRPIDKLETVLFGTVQFVVEMGVVTAPAFARELITARRFVFVVPPAPVARVKNVCERDDFPRIVDREDARASLLYHCCDLRCK